MFVRILTGFAIVCTGLVACSSIFVPFPCLSGWRGSEKTPRSKAFVLGDTDFHIGGRLGSSFEGFVDEVGVFEAVLSPSDINSVMDNGLGARVFSVSPSKKLSTAWGKIKARRE